MHRGYTWYPGITGEEFFALRARTDVFEDVAAINGVNANLTDGDEMERVPGGSATDNFIPLLGVPLLTGRPLSARRDIGTDYVRSVVISYELWQRRWQGDVSIVGRHISVNNIDVEVVGITPRGFRTYLGTDMNVSPRVDIERRYTFRTVPTWRLRLARVGLDRCRRLRRGCVHDRTPDAGNCGEACAGC
jgi:hypothetical protein